MDFRGLTDFADFSGSRLFPAAGIHLIMLRSRPQRIGTIITMYFLCETFVNIVVHLLHIERYGSAPIIWAKQFF